MNKITEVIPLFVLFTIVAIVLGHGSKMISMGISDWIMLAGSLFLLSALFGFIFDDLWIKVQRKCAIGATLMLLGGVTAWAF